MESHVVVDTRVRGKLTKRLDRLARRVVDSEDLVEADEVRLKNDGGPFVMPDCESCTDRCCVHKEVGSGILLSLQDVANLVDSGLEDLIVGTFTFKKKKGRVLPEIDKMPRLAKKQGNCIFYDEDTGRCTGYGFRPTICRRFPYEVEYKKKSQKPFARFIPWAHCPTKSGDEYEPAIRQMVMDAVEDENISFDDAMLLPDHVEELRRMGFGPYLPPPEDCP